MRRGRLVSRAVLMRVFRIVAVALLPAVAACWIERPNLQSTGGGYPKDAAAATSAPSVDHGPAAEREGPAEAPAPAETAPAES